MPISDELEQKRTRRWPLKCVSSDGILDYDEIQDFIRFLYRMNDSIETPPKLEIPAFYMY